MNSKNGYKFFDKNNNLLNIQSCYNCSVCQEWKDHPWKSRIFCPVHCYYCHHAGYDDEFIIHYSSQNKEFGLFLCLNCEKKIKYFKNPINLIKRQIGICHFK